MHAVSQINPRVRDGVTSQGFYVIGPDGQAFGFNNNRNVDRVLDMLRKARSAFLAAPKRPGTRPELKDVSPAAPPGTIVLRMYSRISPIPKDSHPSNENLQRDHVWILSDEAAQLRSGSDVPETLVARFCRFAFVDAVRGEPDFWKTSEILERKFRIQTAPDGRRLLTGEFRMATADGRRGLNGRLEAVLTYAGATLSNFRGFASAVAWGASTYTPNPPPGQFPMKFAFVLATNAIDTVAPQAAMYGAEYLRGE
ncbi:MAG: hypothetical protein AKCLJLPJ_00563 [Fimbriimonadales bacterium]|nr:hypothetical protein [Fimbriimonadales bacterium]